MFEFFNKYLIYAVQLVIKALHVRPDQTVPAEECMLKISLQPLRLNVDQVHRFFIFTDHVSTGGKAIAFFHLSVHLSVCFRCMFQTD